MFRVCGSQGLHTSYPFLLIRLCEFEELIRAAFKLKFPFLEASR